MNYYSSPRWSQEITDCALPLTFDQYSLCGFRCLYCFSFFQKAIGGAKDDYLRRRVRPVSVEAVKRIFTEPGSQFWPFIEQRRVMQWGGLADPFCPYEKIHGVGLELLRFFREIDYPISFSTKGTWWLRQPEYRELFQGNHNFHVKVSIITNDEAKAKVVEHGVPTPSRRLRAIEQLAALDIGGITLRLRPFIIGVSTPGYLDLIRDAAAAGADSVSTEFMCLETRSRRAKPRWRHLSQVAGYDVAKMYRTHSPGQAGYLRLNREIKRPFMLAMAELCDELGLKFYVSDAHFKELSHTGCCCGLDEHWNWSRGQFAEALLIAKRKGTVAWSDIEGELGYAEAFTWAGAAGFNTSTSEARSKFHNFTMKDWLRWVWNNPRSGKGPYKYFGGVLIPVEADKHGDLVYEYRGDQALVVPGGVDEGLPT